MSTETSKGKHYTIDLSRIGDTRVKLEAELRSDDHADEILELYLGDYTEPRDPLDASKINEVGLPNEGEVLNPLLHMLYDYDEGTKGYQDSTALTRLKDDLANKGIEPDDYNEVMYGNNLGTFIPTPAQLFAYPKASTRALARAVSVSESRMGLTSQNYKLLLKNNKKFLTTIRNMYAKILSRLDADSSVSATEGVEASNGLYLFHSLIKRRTHTEQLATILGLLTSAKLLPSVKSGSRTAPETVKQLFKRIRKMARDTMQFKIMAHPIPEPILKVWAIHALLRSDKTRYQPFAAECLKEDLSESWTKMLTNAETYEGNRIEDIIREYAPSSSALAQVQQADGSKNGARRGGSKNNRRKKSEYTRSGNCYHYTEKGTCRFGARCKFKHSIKARQAWLANQQQKEGDSNLADGDDARFKEDETQTAETDSARAPLEDPFSFINSDEDFQ